MIGILALAFCVFWLLAYVVAVIVRASEKSLKTSNDHPPIADPKVPKRK